VEEEAVDLSSDRLLMMWCLLIQKRVTNCDIMYCNILTYAINKYRDQALLCGHSEPQGVHLVTPSLRVTGLTVYLLNLWQRIIYYGGKPLVRCAISAPVLLTKKLKE
jgi:hypothetical protein